jgi:hypothetical protein
MTPRISLAQVSSPLRERNRNQAQAGIRPVSVDRQSACQPLLPGPPNNQSKRCCRSPGIRKTRRKGPGRMPHRWCLVRSNQAKSSGTILSGNVGWRTRV